jgi:nicotinate-nucleotide pyrophosphorylase (carboxylating)
MNGKGGSKSKDRARVPWDSVQRLIREALREDIGGGDFTTKWIVTPRKIGEASIIFKEKAVLAGIDIACRVWKVLDNDTTVTKSAEDGDRVGAGMSVARISGRLRPLLTGERTALNFLQRLSGVATLTAEFVEKVKGTGVKILDTRKTTPGFRLLDKYAVCVGGGVNHRIGLYDMILVKENHLRSTGDLAEAYNRIKQKNKSGLRIEIEVKNLQELGAALELKGRVDVIMLDNMKSEDMREAVKKTIALCKGKQRPLLEASGNITIDNVREVAETGIDLISVGALTHSARAVDISFEVD